MKTKKYLLNYKRRSYKTSKNIFKSFNYAFNGFIYCYRYTKNFRIQLFFAILILFIGFLFNLNANEYLILLSTIFSVLILELLNTAIESLVDLTIEKKFSKLAKISKDCSAASVLLASINSVFVAAYIFLPKIKIFF